LNKGITDGKILSCHDISEGGLLTSVFDMCVGGDMGVKLKIKTRERTDYLLFSETAGTFLEEVENEKIAKKIFGNIPYKIIGKTKKEKNIEVWSDKRIFSADLYELKNAWKKPMQKIFK
jgi:phosphoribosylformylglycinamidine synthase